jgi:hypothetical protein
MQINPESMGNKPGQSTISAQNPEIGAGAKTLLQ